VLGTAVGANRTYIFNFGEGENKSQKETVISHTYQKAGTYTAKLQVVDKDGRIIIGDCSKQITATTKVEVKGSSTPKPATTLPKTGPETYLLLLIAPISGIGMWLYKRFKLL
jgi:PKD repeat protein